MSALLQEVYGEVMPYPSSAKLVDPVALVQSVFGGVVVVEEDGMGTPFDVTEEYSLGDLSAVKEDRLNVPAASGVLLRVQAASARVSKDGSIKSVTVQVNLVEGIDVADPASGTVTKKYANKAMFADLPYWADTTIRTTPKYAGANKAFLVPLKQFLAALGYDLTNPPKLNDTFYGEVVGRELRADIRLSQVRAKNPVTQQWEPVLGEFRNEIRNFRTV